MNMRQLRYFNDAAKSENFAKVAEKYMIPASAVSVGIKHLEEELGVSLFERSANSIRLNEKGRLFAAEVSIILSKMDTVTKQITEAPEPLPQIKVLIRARPKWITELIAQFKTGNPNISFIISNDYTITNIDGFDVIIDEESKKYANWDRFLLSTEIICVKASSDNPLVNKTLNFRDLKDQVFILPSKGNGMRNLYERICQQHGIIPNVAIECNDRQCLQYYVQSNMGLTLGAYRALDDHTQTNISALHVMDFNEIQSVCVFHRQTDNRAINSFCSFLYDQRYI